MPIFSSLIDYVDLAALSSLYQGAVISDWNVDGFMTSLADIESESNLLEQAHFFDIAHIHQFLTHDIPDLVLSQVLRSHVNQFLTELIGVGSCLIL